MSGSPPRKSTLKRGIGSRTLVNVNGRAIVAAALPRRLMFSNVTRVRPFNFRNAAVKAATANSNTDAALVTGKNARGNPPIIEPHDPRKNPAFAEAMGTNIAALKASMAANSASLHSNLAAYLEERATPNSILGLPVKSVMRTGQPNMNRRGAKEMYLMAAQYESGHSVPELNQLAMEGANDEYIAEEVEGLKQPYRNIVASNENVARQSAEINAEFGQRIINNAAREPRARRSRRNRKTRRNRK
jgi:hypothetical protein